MYVWDKQTVYNTLYFTQSAGIYIMIKQVLILVSYKHSNDNIHVCRYKIHTY